MHNESDEAIYLRFLSERREADMIELLHRYEEGLTLFLYGYVRNLQDAEELTYDTFAAISFHRGWRRNGASFKTWLFSVAQKQALMFLRKHRIRQEPLDESLAAPELTDSRLLREERNRNLYTAMNLLNPEYREVLYLHYFEQLSHAEISRVMGRDLKQVYNLMERGRAALKTRLEGMGIHDADG